MILYQKNLKSKELTEYVDFLKRIKTLGSDFLVKGDMWIPCVKTPENTPGIHISKDPMLHEYYNECKDFIYTKFTCSHLEETVSDLAKIKGKKTFIMFEMTDVEISLYINDTQWVIASKYMEETVDFYPSADYFNSLLEEFNDWYHISDEILQALIDGHPVTLYGTVSGTDEKTSIRLAKKLMKLRGVSCRKLDHSGRYTLAKVDNGMFDETICRLIIHMKYSKIECVNMYYMRKY